MKGKKNKKEDFKSQILRNNLMMRFIREIEREENLDNQLIESMLAYNPVRIGKNYIFSEN